MNGKYSAKDIFEKITFRISVGTSHDFNIDELVALDLGNDHIFEHLLCHTHPVLLFNRRLVDVFSHLKVKLAQIRFTASSSSKSITLMKL